MRMRTLIYVLTSTLVVSAHADQMTIPQLVRLSAPQPVRIERSREMAPANIDDVLAKSDLILHGTVVPSKTYLSDDQRELYTDYAVTPLRVMFQQRLETAAMPGAPLPVVVRRWGGETIIDGVRVSAEDMNLRQFRAGEQLVLMLTARKDGKYQIVGDVAGVLAVVDGKIASTIQSALKAEPAIGLTVAQFETSVRRVKP